MCQCLPDLTVAVRPVLSLRCHWMPPGVCVCVCVCVCWCVCVVCVRERVCVCVCVRREERGERERGEEWVCGCVCGGACVVWGVVCGLWVCGECGCVGVV